ncbi:MAG TPA: hypothetical protein VF691_13945 [Cytophagaceae bacterium]|jgi:hypothetical protein
MKTSNYIIILLAFLFFTLASCSQTDGNGSLYVVDTKQSIDNKNYEQQVKGPFSSPRKLAAALSQNGIGELKEWQNPMEMGWGSLTGYHQFGAQNEGATMQNNIAYNLEGTEAVVTSLTINLNINNTSDKKNALRFLAEIAQKTFSSMNLIIPSDLKKAILQSKEFKGELDNYSIFNQLENSKIETWKVVIR